MMSEHKFSLEKFTSIGKSRFDCPQCRGKKEFTRYIDNETGEYLSEFTGKCNREANCGYHYTPKEYFKENPSAKEKHITKEPFIRNAPARICTPNIPIQYLPDTVIKKSISEYKSNNLYRYFECVFGPQAANLTFELYRVGSSKHWDGATVFNQQDYHGNFRQAKVMAYDQQTGKRIKNESPAMKLDHITKRYTSDIGNGDKIFFAGKAIMKNKDSNLLQCFFGEYLLRLFPKKPVAIVESEKTAMVASLFLPEYVWIATGGKNGCKWREVSVNKVLDNRQVFLFPDLGQTKRNSAAGGKEIITYHKLWKEYSAFIEGANSVEVSDILLCKATPEEVNSGFDLADYLLRDYNYRETLIAGFKNAIINSGYDEGEQDKIWLAYSSRGLQVEDARSVINDLINNSGFTY